MTTTIKLPVPIENLIESIFGSGATYTYWWYYKVRECPELGPAYSVGLWTDEEQTRSSHALIDERVLAETIEKIVENRLDGWQSVLHGALNDDFDADSADVVIQTAVLGKVVWG